MRRIPSTLFFILFIALPLAGQTERTGWFTSTIFGSLWRGDHQAEIGDSSYVEPGLRPFLPPQAFEDLAYARHPKGPELAHELELLLDLPVLSPADFSVSIASDSLLSLLSRDPGHRADAQAYSRIRLFDLLIGDWSRGPADVRWTPESISGVTVWRPHASTYRNAFTRYDGLLPWILILMSDYMSSWSPHMSSSMLGSHPLRFVDRRLLSSLPWPAWEAASTGFMASFTDTAIDSLCSRVLGTHAEPMRSLLRKRLEQTPALTRDLHRRMTRFVEIHPDGPADSLYVRIVSDRAIEVHHGWKDGQVQIISALSTQEVRFHLSGGTHTLWIEGREEPSFDLIAEIGQQGSTVWHRPSPSRSWIRGAPRRLELYHTPYPESEIALDDSWGHRTSFIPWTDANEDDWIFLGTGIEFTSSAYRTLPFGTRISLWAGVATRTRGIRVKGSFESRTIMKHLTLGIQTQYSQLDIANFYGPGNETTAPDLLLSQSFFKTDQRTIEIGPFARYTFSPTFSVGLKPNVRFVHTDPRSGSLIDSLIGAGYPAKMDYGSIALDALFDSRDRTVIPTRGMYATASITLFPKTLKNSQTFLRFDVESKYYHYIGHAGMHVLLRSTGSYITGDYPWFESAFIGGTETLRGFRRQRFAGDAALSGSLEWRVPLGRLQIFWPLDLGAIVFTDAGRVFLKDENSRRWHSSAGVGLWVQPARWPFSIAMSVAASDERFEFLATFGEPVTQ